MHHTHLDMALHVPLHLLLLLVPSAGGQSTSECEYVEHEDGNGRKLTLRVNRDRNPNDRQCLNGMVLIDESNGKEYCIVAPDQANLQMTQGVFSCLRNGTKCNCEDYPPAEADGTGCMRGGFYALVSCFMFQKSASHLKYKCHYMCCMCTWCTL